MSAGTLTITGHPDGRWTVSIDNGRPKAYRSFDDALRAAATVSFAPGESPGSWRVLITEP